ncbi:MAG TPA: L-threonylcarbamoyladenylate synthase [Deltaproteobacteria bacterium]|nr:L-threonylcarbamoyladenylate synthase [Deltaproteobacteria bacterium]
MLITSDPAQIIAYVARRSDAVFAYPTETFYGLGARIGDHDALERIISIKGREGAKGMIVLVADMIMAKTVARIGKRQQALLEQFWPGPLSALLQARPGLHALLCVDGKVALRVSPNAMAAALCRALGPITSTSANFAGHPPARTAPGVQGQGLEIDAILDGGTTPGGAPSTLADLTVKPIRCLRVGALPWSDISGRE